MEEQKQKIHKKMQDNVESFTARLRKMRTGRAQSALLENINVMYYGISTPLSQMATISVSSPRSLVITPFDIKSLKDIEHALVKANLGLTPQNDGKLIRLSIPELTEERRKDLMKEVKKETEKCRVDLRNSRRLINEEVKQMLKEKSISEDVYKKWSADLQTITDQFMTQVDTTLEAKEKEIMEI